MGAAAIELIGSQRAGGRGEGPDAHAAVEAGGEEPAVIGKEADAPGEVRTTELQINGLARGRVPNVNETAAADGDEMAVVVTKSGVLVLPRVGQAEDFLAVFHTQHAGDVAIADNDPVAPPV